nr:MAG TPA: hypothetical protein [Caudoviricetes sp.]
MKKFTVESKMRITFELFNDKQIEEVKKIAEENNRTLFSVIAEIYGVANTDLMMYRGNDISNPCRMSIGEEVGQDKEQLSQTLEKFCEYYDELALRDMNNRFSIEALKNRHLELCQTISDLQTENESLKDKLLMAKMDKEMNNMLEVSKETTQAVKEFAEELKMRFDRKYKDRGATDARVLMSQSNFLTCIDELLNEWVEK